MTNVLTNVMTPCNDSHMNTDTDTATVTNASGRVFEVTISAGHQVRTTKGVFLGEVDDMERMGWDFA